MSRLVDADKVAEAIAWLNEYDFVLWNEIMKCIDKVPTVDAVERKRGKWLDNETSYSDDIPQTCTCSICGIRSRRPIGNFCKWCGADMRESKEEKMPISLDGTIISPQLDFEPVRHGRWIYNEKPMLGNAYGSYYCSECGAFHPHRERYCPNCGAKMDKGKKDV